MPTPHSSHLISRPLRARQAGAGFPLFGQLARQPHAARRGSSASASAACRTRRNCHCCDASAQRAQPISQRGDASATSRGSSRCTCPSVAIPLAHDAFNLFLFLPRPSPGSRLVRALAQLETKKQTKKTMTMSTEETKNQPPMFKLHHSPRGSITSAIAELGGIAVWRLGDRRRNELTAAPFGAADERRGNRKAFSARQTKGTFAERC